jgi:hypothetical protein
MEKIRQNIFGIGEVYELQREGQWVERNRESYREYGYFGGGNIFPTSTIVSRIDFSNDTATASRRGDFLSQRRGGRATGNSNFGYFGGGYVVSTVNRIDYSNDSSNSTVRGPLALAADYQAATGNSNFGYFAGGGVNAAGFDISVRSIVSRIDYSNDTNIASRRGDLVKSRAVAGAVSSASFAYFAGGTNYAGNWNVCCPVAAQTNIDRLSFSNDTVRCLLRNNFTTSGRILPGAAGNSSYAWFAGGLQYISALSRVDRLNYSNDTQTLSTRGPLTSARFTPGSAGNSNFGYFGGGGFLSVGTLIDRIDYSNDTAIASARGNIIYDASAATSSASFGGAPVSYLGAPWTATSPYGYFGGGANSVPSTLSTVDRVDYSNDTNTAAVRGPLSNSKSRLAATGNSNFGYFGGGQPGPISTVDRVDYSNDSNSTSVRGSLLTARRYLAATGNSNFGYFGGGIGGPVSAVIERLDFTNDSVATISRGSLSLARYALAATGNSNFGYYLGGFPPTTSIIDRIDYSNDNIVASVRGSLSANRSSLLSSTGNSNFGYNAGGQSLSTIDRIDYFNDTQTALVRGPLSTTKHSLGATGNSNFGYFGGGYSPGAVYRSVVDRLDYSNDTQTASTRGPLSSARIELAASSSQAFGGAPNTPTDPLPTYIRANTVFDDKNTLELPYKRALGSFGYIYSGYTFTTIDRIDYSNDTAKALKRSNVGFVKKDGGAVGNSNFGYSGGGQFFSTVERLDYSNDSASLLRRGDLSLARTHLKATGNSNFGYFFGGYATLSRVDRIDYSNDGIVAITRGDLTLGRCTGASTGNSNFGYYIGGGNGGGGIYYSIIDRLDYSNDSQKLLVRGPLRQVKSEASATGNSNFGYIGSGFISNSPLTYTNTVDRINYLNDTTITLLRSPLNFARRYSGSTGNSNFGYFAAGISASGNVSIVERIDYSNDTQAPSPRGSLTGNKYGLSGTSTARNS